MGDFTVPNDRQAQLCRECNINPDGMAVILENDSVLAMLHHKSGNEVTITKDFAKRREPSSEPMGDFTVPNDRQAQLCRECNINPDGMAVILENDSVLAMLHNKSGNEVTITKGFAQRRKEQSEHV